MKAHIICSTLLVFLLGSASSFAQQASEGRVTDTLAGQTGKRQSAFDSEVLAQTVGRVRNRIENRVQSRVNSRIDRNYDPQANAVKAFVVATAQTAKKE